MVNVPLDVSKFDNNVRLWMMIDLVEVLRDQIPDVEL